jgi:hypothetical protein
LQNASCITQVENEFTKKRIVPFRRGVQARRP